MCLQSYRPLLYCCLQVQISWLDKVSQLTIHPLLIPTPFLPLPTSFPLAPGTPITLLPFGTPAYFLARYTGPTSALTSQFQDSFNGHGVGSWQENAFSIKKGFHANKTPDTSGPTYIIAWISVENKQGEDKGITMIYPTELCLSFTPSSGPRPLDYIPLLPTQLQPSPEVPPLIPSISSHLSVASPLAQPSPVSYIQNSAIQRPSLPPSPTVESVRAFRTLTLSKSKDIRQIASEVGGYVDAIVRERERERERLKREREGGGVGGSPKLSRPTATPGPGPGPGPPATSDIPVPPPVPVMAATSSTLGPSLPLTQMPPSTLLPAQHTDPMNGQTFYPSPPQTSNIPPPQALKTSPVVNTVPVPAIEDADSNDPSHIPHQDTPTTEAEPESFSEATSYYPFGNTESTWTQPSQRYLGMDIDIDFRLDMGMGFGMNMDTLSSNGGGGGNYSDHHGGIDYEDAFTDDDFSFFDQPSRAAPPQPTHLSVHPSLGTSISPGQHGLGMGMSPPLFGDLGLSIPSTTHLNQPSPWSVSGLGEPFTPRFSDHIDRIPPDLLPPSPGDTPQTHSAPATPNIHLEPEYDPDIRRPTTSGSCNFDPIPFSSYHRIADGKYAVGKFALPSPPSERDDEALPLLPSFAYGVQNNWRFNYNARTDPRIGVVRKLIGVKRKNPFEQQVRDGSKSSPAWIREHEDWERSAVVEEEDTKSELESEDDDIEDIESPVVSRPITPPPSYLPLGPTLVHTHFQHSHLLPLSSPLRPPGAAVAPTNIVAVVGPTSVPTPVSPAATLGAASEKSKSLEAAAFMVAQEVVENSVWAQAWRANGTGTRKPTDVWLADIKAVAQLLEAVPTMEGPLDLDSLFSGCMSLHLPAVHQFTTRIQLIPLQPEDTFKFLTHQCSRSGKAMH